MLFDTADTIAAIASAAGGAERGIIRVSGPGTIACLEACFEVDHAAALRGNTKPAILRGSLLVELGPAEARHRAHLPALLYLWPSGRSYTRQITAEIHTLGSPPLLEAGLAAVCRSGARLAGPGEFTLRAFLAGRLDLTQAEAVLGVIDANSERELSTALAQLAGGLAGPLAHLRGDLLDLLAHLEAGLDFVEEDIEFISTAELESQLATAEQAIGEIAARMASRGEAIGEPRIVFVGAPNVGKSSLLNALAGQEAAIVTSQAGTTRDYLVRRVEFDSVACLLVDTAGVDEIDGAAPIDAAAQAFTAAQCAGAALHLFCLDTTRPLCRWVREQLRSTPSVPRLLIGTKCDVPSQSAALELPASGETLILTSSRTGEGLLGLRHEIASHLQNSPVETGVVAGTAARCRESLQLATASLARARQAAIAGGGEEFVAAEVRLALEELGSVVGAGYTDDILDRVFSRFCIGK
jgi:tRNA modification GTPase